MKRLTSEEFAPGVDELADDHGQQAAGVGVVGFAEDAGQIKIVGQGEQGGAGAELARV